MWGMKKILITKKDLAPRIVEKILESEDNKIVLFIPRDSEIKKSSSNFELIKREAEVAGKDISISSLDVEVIEMASGAGIFTESRSEENGGSRSMSDIIPVKRGKGEKRETAAKNRVQKPPKETVKEKEFVAEEKEELKKNLKVGKSFWEKAGKESEIKKHISKIGEFPPAEEPAEKSKPRFGWKRVAVYTAGVVFIIFAVGWMFGAVFGRAEISLSFKKIPWQYSWKITASKTVSRVDALNGYLPAEVFSQPKSDVKLFPATGSAKVSQKAAAKILIYNVYSSSKQKFVASTRFASPDGKIFRLASAVMVPGAGIKDGKIIPSSVDASITAEKAGAEYNIGPVSKMTIPGFKGTPRYDGFYAVMPQQASGGFVGKKQIPTEQDVSFAKDKISQELRNVLQGAFLTGVPPGFNILNEASSTSITRLTVDKNTDVNGNFKIIAGALFQAIGFKNEDIGSFARTVMLKDNPDMNFTELKFDYQNVKPDFASGQLTFSLNANGVITPQFSPDNLKSKIAGRPLNEARAAVVALPDLTNAKISLWPFWMNGLPKDANKINIVWN